MKVPKLYKTSQAAYDGMLKACQKAKKEILFEQYILADYYPGGIAAQFIEVFLEKASEGVKVVLVLDAAGSFRLFIDSGLREKLEKAGVAVYFYKHLPFKMLVSLARFILRNHTKMMTVDRKEVWVGGVVIADEFREWNDLMVRYQNPKIGEKVAKYFYSQIDKYNGKVKFRPEKIALNNHTQLMSNSPGFKNRFISRALHHRIKQSKTAIKIITPYFSPTAPTYLELKKAIKRGVKVTLILPEKTDHGFINHVHRGYFKKLIQLGCQIYLVPSMLHAKLVVIDDWATFGSTNFDTLSLIYNHELNFSSTDPQLLETLNVYASESTQGLKALTLKDLNDSVLGKIKVYLARFLRPIA